MIGNKMSFVCEKSLRLDMFLSVKLERSRSQIALLIERGLVRVDEKVVLKSGFKLKEDSTIEVSQEKPQLNGLVDVDFDVEILYEDSDILVINKPSSLVVHPAPSTNMATLVDWLKSRGINLSTIDERDGIVHRLDKGTSGVMVVAKTNEAHEILSAQLRDRTMGRFYLCVVEPPLKEPVIVDKNIARNPKNRLKMATFSEGGREAKTDFVPLFSSKDEQLSLVACRLHSGRTHQIRVHLESISRHIVGDDLYGVKLSKHISERILLHAYMIYFTHPTTKERVFFTAGFDQYMLEYVYKKFEKEEIENVFKTYNDWKCFSDIF